jgi:hypothetical protein
MLLSAWGMQQEFSEVSSMVGPDVSSLLSLEMWTNRNQMVWKLNFKFSYSDQMIPDSFEYNSFGASSNSSMSWPGMSRIVRNVIIIFTCPILHKPPPNCTLTTWEMFARLRRALLYVPASDPRKIASSFKVNPDCRVFDLEDSVTFEKKVCIQSRALTTT